MGRRGKKNCQVGVRSEYRVPLASYYPLTTSKHHRGIVWFGGNRNTPNYTETYLTFDLTVRASHLWVAPYNEFRDVQKSYDGETLVVKDFNLGPPPKKWSTVIVSKRRIRNGEQTSQTRRNSDEVAAG